MIIILYKLYRINNNKLYIFSIDPNVIVILFVFTCHIADYDSDEDRYERAQQRVVHVRYRVQRCQYIVAERNSNKIF